MNVEGVSSVLALLFDIVNGEIVEVEGMDAEVENHMLSMISVLVLRIMLSLKMES